MNIAELLNNPQKLNEIFEKAIKKKNKEIINLLLPFINSHYHLYKALENNLIEPTPEILSKLAQDYIFGLKYAILIKDRFKEHEKIIEQSPFFSAYLKHLKDIGKLEEFFKDYPELEKFRNFEMTDSEYSSFIHNLNKLTS